MRPQTAARPRGYLTKDASHMTDGSSTGVRTGVAQASTRTHTKYSVIHITLCSSSTAQRNAAQCSTAQHSAAQHTRCEAATGFHCILPVLTSEFCHTLPPIRNSKPNTQPPAHGLWEDHPSDRPGGVAVAYFQIPYEAKLLCDTHSIGLTEVAARQTYLRYIRQARRTQNQLHRHMHELQQPFIGLACSAGFLFGCVYVCYVCGVVW